MKIANDITFKGKIKTIGKINKNQKCLLDQAMPELNAMIKNKSYDLFIKQSKAKNILISTNQSFSPMYLVKKNSHDYVQNANFAIKAKDIEIEKERKMNAEIAYEYIKSKYSNNMLF